MTFRLRRPTAIVTAIALLAAAPSLGQDLVKTEWAPAVRDGSVSCGSKYPATGDLGKAFLHVWNNTCWSCPKGYGRTLDPNVAGDGACQRAPFYRYSRATRHRPATGIGPIKTNCPAGSRQFWHVGDGYCWSCPPGYGRTVHAIDSEKACQRTLPAAFAKAVERGVPGCRPGSFRHFLSDSCYRCPEGFDRSLDVRLDGKLEKLETACVRITPPPPALVLDARNLAKVEAARKRYSSLIEKAAEVAWKLKDHMDEIDAATRERRPIAASVSAATGLDKLAEEADADGFRTISVGAAIDVSAVVGGTVTAGIASDVSHDVESRVPVHTFSSNAYSAGISLGIDAAPEIGIWKAPPNAIAGNGHGVVVGASYMGGIALSFWWDYCPDAGEGGCVFSPFLGFSILPELGFSAEVEYIRGTTRASQP